LHSKNSLPQVDHGIDIIGDEWEEPEEEEVEEILNKIVPLPKKIPMEKKIVPEHPYCTNWPVGDKDK
tara:strand:- start:908 stop:1108 length:201 start_codon:yes stop_codon:yes gene_type:complete